MEFLCPRLVGKRFEGHEIPLEMLKDLAVLQELIVLVAKEEFLRDNHGRQRSPRGFTEGVSLNLARIEDGSTIAVVVLSIAGANNGLFPPAIQTYMERGRDRVLSAINAANTGDSPGQYVSDKSLMHFDRLGRSLRADEAIEFVVPNSSATAKLTLDSRRSLLLSVQSAKEYTEEVILRGVIHEMDQKALTFGLTLDDGAIIQAPVASDHFDTILTAFNGWRTGQRVTITGVARVDRMGKVVAMESLGDVNVVDPLDIVERLQQLKELPDGWLDGAGQKLDGEGVEWLSAELDNTYPNDLPLPHIYPTPDGNVQLEWGLGREDVSVTIELSTKQSRWHRLNLESDEEEERVIALDLASGWESLFESLRALGGAE